MTAKIIARKRVCALTIPVEETGVDCILGTREARCEPGVFVGVSIQEVNFQRQHFMHNNSESPDIDIIRVRVAPCSELAGQESKWLRRAVDGRAAMGFQRRTDPTFGDSEIGDLHPDGRERRDKDILPWSQLGRAIPLRCQTCGFIERFGL